MCNFSFSVAIATFNRSRLLGRAVQSVLDQAWPDMEILVVDDASTDDTQEFVANNYPHVRYLRQDHNRGCGAARNRALLEATNPYVLILDDDDTLLPGSLALIAARMADIPDLVKYPVVNFAHGEAELCAPYVLVRFEDYIQEALYGDFVPVVCRALFLREELAYPMSRVGGEHLLWWKIAECYGIPTWADRIGSVHTDAPIRLTSVASQIAHACEHAEIQERTLQEFAEVLRARYPAYYLKKLLGAATYRLLAGDRTEARSHLRAAMQWKRSKNALGLWILSYLPAPILRTCFVAYRRRSGVVA